LRWLVLILLGLCLNGTVFGQDGSYSASDLDTLVGPIALYPDPLLNSIVAGAAHPDQIQKAAASSGKSPQTSWDTGVQALCAYPDVLTMMNKNKDWTQAIGWAGVNQSTELMDAVQRFRFQAESAGNLKSNDKMLVIEEGTTIRIEPANPQIIYVPTYQPGQVVVQNNSAGIAFLGFGLGVATSALLYNNYWHNGGWYHPPGGWYPPPAWARPYGANGGWGGGGWGNSYNPHTNINRPVNINNINTGNINIGNGNRVNNGGNRVNNRPAVMPNNRPAISNWPSAPLQRPSMPTQTPRVNQGGQFMGGENRNQSRPSMSNYSRSGSTSRESVRGAQSRGSSSYSRGGQRSSGGGGRRR